MEEKFKMGYVGSLALKFQHDLIKKYGLDAVIFCKKVGGTILTYVAKDSTLPEGQKQIDPREFDNFDVFQEAVESIFD